MRISFLPLNTPQKQRETLQPHFGHSKSYHVPVQTRVDDGICSIGVCYAVTDPLDNPYELEKIAVKVFMTAPPKNPHQGLMGTLRWLFQKANTTRQEESLYSTQRHCWAALQEENDKRLAQGQPIRTPEDLAEEFRQKRPSCTQSDQRLLSLWIPPHYKEAAKHDPQEALSLLRLLGFEAPD